MCHSFFLADVAEVFVGGGVVGIELQRSGQLRGRTVVVAEKKENDTAMQVQSGKERIELRGPIYLGQRFILATEIGKAETIMRRNVGEVRIQLHATGKRAIR